MTNQTQYIPEEQFLYFHNLNTTNWSKLDFFEQCFRFNTHNQTHNCLFLLEINASVIASDFYVFNYQNEILTEIKFRLNRFIKDGSFYRFSDNVFLIMLNFSHDDKNHVAHQITKFTDDLKQHLSKEIILYGNRYKPSLNMGGCIFDSQETNFYAVLKEANFALHHAKKQGRNETCVFNFDMLKNVELSFTELAHAIARNEFQVFYQAQLNKSGDITGAEALIRWNHPVKGLIQPNDFILFAEQSELIIPIGYLIIQKICQQLSKWQLNESTKHLTLSVNISYKQMMQPEFVEQIFSLIKDMRIDPTKLTFEISQSLFAHDISSLLHKINELRLMGIKFTLDNFGIGHSALAYLRMLPFDQIKIDRSFIADSFIADITTNSNVTSLIHIIIDEAKIYHCEVIAMGVESKEQQNLLDIYGCHLYQGFMFSQPLPIKDFESFVKESLSTNFLNKEVNGEC
jgi:EAL domain-containing protein (putative c-di-GMP-specific phosphodiesterase class I)/GGDEF domain-containing protein